MILKKSTVFIIVLTVGFTPILSTASAIGESSSFNSLEIPESYVIKGVPYIGQENDRMCVHACDTMCFRYYGINATQKEILYLDGAAYCSANHPRLNSRYSPPNRFTCWPGWYLGQMDYKFYVSLYNLSIIEWEPENWISDGKCWREYWSKVKYYISKDIPLETTIDPCAWAIYKNYHGWSRTPFFKRGGHTIVIVGYNEANGTICYHDPMATLYNQPDKAGYAWEDLTVFRIAVRRAGGFLNSYSYSLVGYEKVSDPLPAKERIEIAHKRNIEKIKGNKSVYYELGARNFHNFGIEAIKSLKKEFLLLQKTIPLAFYCFKEIILQRLAEGGDVFHNLLDASRTHYIMKHNVSQYLMENVNLSPICKYDATLLENESKCWKEINSLVSELNEIHINNGLIKSMRLSKSIVNEIISWLDKIIIIEETIIAGPIG